jgi:hypothetical protein
VSADSTICFFSPPPYPGGAHGPSPPVVVVVPVVVAVVVLVVVVLVVVVTAWATPGPAFLSSPDEHATERATTATAEKSQEIERIGPIFRAAARACQRRPSGPAATPKLRRRVVGADDLGR